MTSSTNSRALWDQVSNIIDTLVLLELALCSTHVKFSDRRVSWTPHDPQASLILRGPPRIEEYLHWVRSGHYSCVLFDGSLLQLTYDFSNDGLVGHRLAYVPCPFELDVAMLRTDSLLDVIDAHSDGTVILRSTVRFDYDPAAAGPGHPATHLTINSADCRIACVAPLHVGSFVEFIFSSFYPALRNAHSKFFASLRGYVGVRSLTDHEANSLHLSWAQPR